MDRFEDTVVADIARLHAEATHPVLGSGLLVIALAWLPASFVQFEFGLLHLIPLLLITTGCYILIVSRFAHVIIPAVLITLGVGTQAVMVGLMSPMELIAIWPLALITFGLIVILSTFIDDWRGTSIYHR